MTPRIRPAGPTDAVAARALAQLAYAGYVPRIGRRPAPMGADYAAAFATPGSWVAEDPDGDPALLGFVVTVPHPDHLLLENVAVAPEARGLGLGRRLVARAETAALALGLSEVRLYTNAAMTENLAWYPSLGYVEVGRGRQDGFERVFFVKHLDRPA